MTMSEPKIDDDADSPLEDDAEDFPSEYAISSYGADYPVDSLVNRLKDGRGITIPGFQRGYVWTQPQASRFIESLLLGLPVPGIFLCKEETSNKLIVIDGQQRLESLQRFFKGTFGNRVFALKGVSPRFDGKTYDTLDAEDRLRLEDSVIHATVIKQERPEDDSSSIFRIFERLNTGGTPLGAQEIRAALYYDAPLRDRLETWNQERAWRTIFGERIDPRSKDEELILRFIALYDRPDDYKRPMRAFLNKYLRRSKKFESADLERLGAVFERTIATVEASLGRSAFRPQGTLNVAVFDGVMVGLARRLERGRIDDREGLRAAYDRLLLSKAFQNAYRKATADEESVRTRLLLATKAFEGLT